MTPDSEITPASNRKAKSDIKNNFWLAVWQATVAIAPNSGGILHDDGVVWAFQDAQAAGVTAGDFDHRRLIGIDFNDCPHPANFAGQAWVATTTGLPINFWT